MKLVTVATKSEGYFPWLKQSCERFNQELVVLGWGEEWKGFTWRFKLVMDYLESLPPDEIVCFIDGYDVLLLRPLDNLEKDFVSMVKGTNYKIIVGFEDIKTVQNKIMAYLFFGNCNGIQLNAGTYIGYVKDILEILQEMYDNDKNDDQLVLTEYCNKYNDKILIDTDARLFATIVDKEISKHIDIKNNLVTYKNRNPYILHAPAHGCLNLVLRNLGYGISKEQKEAIYKEVQISSLKKNHFYIKLVCSKYMIVILILIYFLFKRYRKRG